MSLQVRPVSFWDLPTLKRWRSLPSVQQHLRHPHITWRQHLLWWVRIQRDPTCRVWAITRHGKLVGLGGFYYRMGPAAEVSLLMMQGDREAFVAEKYVLEHLLTPLAKAWGLNVLWAEVLTTAPLPRHAVFAPHKPLWEDSYSTLYRWSIA